MSRSPWASHLPQPDSRKRSIPCLPWDVSTWQMCSVRVCVYFCGKCEEVAPTPFSFCRCRLPALAFSLFGPFFLLLVCSTEPLSQRRSLSAPIYLMHNCPPLLSFYLFPSIPIRYLFLLFAVQWTTALCFFAPHYFVYTSLPQLFLWWFLIFLGCLRPSMPLFLFFFVLSRKCTSTFSI